MALLESPAKRKLLIDSNLHRQSLARHSICFIEGSITHEGVESGSSNVAGLRGVVHPGETAVLERRLSVGESIHGSGELEAGVFL
jgi:hypothetical protein